MYRFKYNQGLYHQYLLRMTHGLCMRLAFRAPSLSSALRGQTLSPWRRTVLRTIASASGQSADSQHRVRLVIGSRKGRTALLTSIQLLSANLQEADPTMFDIIQKVPLLPNTQNATDAREIGKKEAEAFY